MLQKLWTLHKLSLLCYYMCLFSFQGLNTLQLFIDQADIVIISILDLYSTD